MHVHSCEGRNEMLFKCCDGPFCSVDSMVVRGNELDVDLFRPDVFFNRDQTFIVHYIQRRDPSVLRVVITSVNAVTMDASVREGMAQTMIALRLYTYATNI